MRAKHNADSIPQRDYTYTEGLLDLLSVDEFDDLLHITLGIPVEQLLKEVLVRVIIDHLVFQRLPTLCEIKTRLLQVKLEHL